MASSPLGSELLERLRVVARESGDERAAMAFRAIAGGKASSTDSELESRGSPERESFGIATLDAMLAEAGGLPSGVVELAAPEGLARSTHLALKACATAQRAHEGISCAFIDPSRTLHAPGVAQQGVDLGRMLIVQPPPDDVARAAVRLTSSGLFARVVVDRWGTPGASVSSRRIRWSIAVRRLALAAERHETTILLLSDLDQARRDTLPVAMRIELTRPEIDRLSLRIVKERRGRIPPPCTVSLSALSLGAVSLGAVSLGAVSLGSLSVGSLSVGAVSVGTVSLGSSEESSSRHGRAS